MNVKIYKILSESLQWYPIYSQVLAMILPELPSINTYN